MKQVVGLIADHATFLSVYGNYVLILAMVIIYLVDRRVSKGLSRGQKVIAWIGFGVPQIALGALIFMINFPLKPMVTALATVDRSIGANVADFDYLNVGNGEVENIRDYDEKVVLLNIWATYCGPCVREFPDLKKLESTFPENLVVVAISEEAPERIRQFLEKVESPSIVGSQEEGRWINPESFLPLSIIINRGVVTERFFGRKTYEEFEAIVRETLQNPS